MHTIISKYRVIVTSIENKTYDKMELLIETKGIQIEYNKKEHKLCA